jgi:hypothetical protein
VSKDVKAGFVQCVMLYSLGVSRPCTSGEMELGEKVPPSGSRLLILWSPPAWSRPSTHNRIEVELDELPKKYLGAIWFGLHAKP